jgi:hypothetical protein
MSELLTVADVAQILGISADGVTRKFAKVKGVVDIGSPETPKRRRYRVLRIPVSVVEKYLRDRGGPITVTPPERKKPSRPASPPSADELALQLAAVTKQHGQQAQKTLDRIAERARLMQYVPQEQWQDMVWFDEEDDAGV